MGRLIDADALIEFIDAGHLRHPSELCFSEVDVVNMLNHAPIAYDVEKVAEDLQKVSMIIEQNENSIKCAIEENMAVHIVKRGGLE